MGDDAGARTALAPAPEPVLVSDPHGFAGLYIRHRASFTSHARRYLRDPRDADEVVQEAFLRLFLTMPELETELQALAYCRRTITNLCIDRYRADARRPRLVALEGATVEELAEDDTGDPVVRAEDAALVRAALSQLPALHRAALVMREIEEKSLPVIADELDVPEENVKHVLFRARRTLRKLLAGTSVAPGADAELTRGLRPATRGASSGVAALILLALLGLGSGPDLRAVPVVGVDLPDVLGVTAVAEAVGDILRDVVEVVVPRDGASAAASEPKAGRPAAGPQGPPARDGAAPSTAEQGNAGPAAGALAGASGQVRAPAAGAPAQQSPQAGGPASVTGGVPVSTGGLSARGAPSSAGPATAGGPMSPDVPGRAAAVPLPTVGGPPAPAVGREAPSLAPSRPAPLVGGPPASTSGHGQSGTGGVADTGTEHAASTVANVADRAAERREKAADKVAERREKAADKAAERRDKAADRAADRAADTAAAQQRADEDVAERTARAAEKADEAADRAADKAVKADDKLADRSARTAARSAERAAAQHGAAAAAAAEPATAASAAVERAAAAQRGAAAAAERAAAASAAVERAAAAQRTAAASAAVERAAAAQRAAAASAAVEPAATSTTTTPAVPVAPVPAP